TGSSQSRSEELIARAAEALDMKSADRSELERVISEAGPAAKRIAKAASEGGIDQIDLNAGDLEPVSHQVKSAAGAAMAKAQKTIDAKQLKAEGITAELAIGTGDMIDELLDLEMPNDETDPVAAGASIQPLGMSVFERLALSTIIASESHLAELAESGDDEPVTKPVSTIAGEDGAEESRPPVVIEETDSVEAVINRAPASQVSPGLDEMVISSTSQTDFDLNDSEMTFSGNVQVKSPRFNLRADKFIVHLKGDRSGMSHGEAIGNVVIELRESGKPTGYTGLADRALYHPKEGKITLSGWPKIRQQYKEHVAVTRDTKMVLYTDGRVKTLGRNRTLIRK
ncbi:MAG: LptA/OstA family protein, partial [Verrucomicrobiales bacterium]